MNKLFRFTAAALLVASFGVLGNYTADAAKFLESPREVEIVKPELPEVPQTATVAPNMRVRFLIDKKGNVKNVFVERSSGYAPVDEAVKKPFYNGNLHLLSAWTKRLMNLLLG